MFGHVGYFVQLACEPGPAIGIKVSYTSHTDYENVAVR